MEVPAARAHMCIRARVKYIKVVYMSIIKYINIFLILTLLKQTGTMKTVH